VEPNSVRGTQKSAGKKTKLIVKRGLQFLLLVDNKPIPTCQHKNSDITIIMIRDDLLEKVLVYGFTHIDS
jgi:hypothetical protein